MAKVNKTKIKSDAAPMEIKLFLLKFDEKIRGTERNKLRRFFNKWSLAHPGFNLQGGIYANRRFSRLNFSGLNLRGSLFKNCDFYGAKFNSVEGNRPTILQDCQFKNCNLSRATLLGTDCRRASFEGSVLSFANCRGANFFRANLNVAQNGFMGTILTESQLCYSDFNPKEIAKAVIYGCTISRLRLAQILLALEKSVQKCNMD